MSENTPIENRYLHLQTSLHGVISREEALAILAVGEALCERLDRLAEAIEVNTAAEHSSARLDLAKQHVADGHTRVPPRKAGKRP